MMLPRQTYRLLFPKVGKAGLGGDAAIDHDELSGDERCIRTGEKSNQFADLRGETNSAKRMLCDNLGHQIRTGRNFAL